MMSTSQRLPSSRRSPSRSAVVRNRRIARCESVGASAVGPRSNVTRHPRRAASSASAIPSRPDERFPMNRTASIGSYVGPAVIKSRRPEWDLSGLASSGQVLPSVPVTLLFWGLLSNSPLTDGFGCTQSYLVMAAGAALSIVTGSGRRRGLLSRKADEQRDDAARKLFARYHLVPLVRTRSRRAAVPGRFYLLSMLTLWRDPARNLATS